MNLTPWNNNAIQRGGSSNTSSALQSAAKKTDVVSTAKPIEGFRQISDGEVASYKEEVKQQGKFVKNFLQYCELNLKHQKLDTVATKGLVKWRLGTTKELADKQLLIEKQIAGQRKIAENFIQAREKIHNPQQSKGQRSEVADYAQNTLWS